MLACRHVKAIRQRLSICRTRAGSSSPATEQVVYKVCETVVGVYMVVDSAADIIRTGPW
jgi:hypothetical protein